MYLCLWKARCAIPVKKKGNVNAANTLKVDSGNLENVLRNSVKLKLNNHPHTCRLGNERRVVISHQRIGEMGIHHAVRKRYLGQPISME